MPTPPENGFYTAITTLDKRTDQRNSCEHLIAILFGQRPDAYCNPICDPAFKKKGIRPISSSGSLLLCPTHIPGTDAVQLFPEVIQRTYMQSDFKNGMGF